MNYPVSKQAQAVAGEVLTLLKKYEEAGYSLGQMGVSAKTWDPTDRQNMPNGIMPIRIRGELYKVSEDAGSCVSALGPFLSRAESEGGVANPRALCIRSVERVLSLLKSGSTVTVASSSAAGKLKIAGQELPQVAVYVTLIALNMRNFDFGRLSQEEASLVPV